MAATLDLSNRPELLIFADKGKSTNDLDLVYALSLVDIPLALDTSYTLILNEGLTGEVEYTVGSGLTIITETKSIVWELDTAALAVGEHKGYLVSNSNIDGIYLQINITLTIK